jgi:hypothetical protein
MPRSYRDRLTAIYYMDVLHIDVATISLMLGTVSETELLFDRARLRGALSMPFLPIDSVLLKRIANREE